MGREQGWGHGVNRRTMKQVRRTERRINANNRSGWFNCGVIVFIMLAGVIGGAIAIWRGLS